MFGHASGKEGQEDSTQYQERLVPTAAAAAAAASFDVRLGDADAASFDVQLEDCRQQMPDSILERINVYHQCQY